MAATDDEFDAPAAAFKRRCLMLATVALRDSGDDDDDTTAPVADADDESEKNLSDAAQSGRTGKRKRN